MSVCKMRKAAKQVAGWFPSYYRKLGDVFRVRRIVKNRANEKEPHDARLELQVDIQDKEYISKVSVVGRWGECSSGNIKILAVYIK